MTFPHNNFEACCEGFWTTAFNIICVLGEAAERRRSVFFFQSEAREVVGFYFWL